MNKIEIEHFQENGFLIVDNPAESKFIDNAKNSFKKILLKAKKENYRYVRVYDDYINKLNLAGIESVFHPEIIDQNIVELLNRSKIISYAKNILGENIKLTLSRYHITENISHVGIWHRDALVNQPLNTLQINYYLFDERGMQIIPKSHLNELREKENSKINKYPYSKLKEAQFVETKQTQILIFNPALLHRGISANKRANLHFRFEKKDNIINTKSACELDYEKKKFYYKNIKFSDEWKEIVFSDKSIIFSKNLKKYHHPQKLKNKLLRIFRYTIYNVMFFFPINFLLYKKFNVRPNLKLRKYFKISY